MAQTPQFAEINGTRIAYDVTGSGFPLLMQHGFPRTRRTWESVTPALAERFTVVAPDRRGYGDSDRGSAPEAYENGNLAADCIALADHLGWREFMVVGHDKGAPVARRLAADLSGRVRGTMLIDGVPAGAVMPERKDLTGRTWYFDFFRQRGFAEQIIGQNPGLFFGLFLDRNPHLSPEEHAFYVAEYSKPGSVDAVLADYRADLEVDPGYWKDQMAAGRKIETPLYIIWGDKGAAANAPVLDAWHQAATNVRGEVVANAGHYVHEMQPKATIAHIMRFADELGVP